MPTPRVINCVLANPRSLTLQTNELPEHPVVVEQDNTPAVNHRQQVNIQRTLGLLSRLIVYMRSAKSCRSAQRATQLACPRFRQLSAYEAWKVTLGFWGLS